jgi:hypothetical protein
MFSAKRVDGRVDSVIDEGCESCKINDIPPDRKNGLTKYTSRVTYERPSSRDRIENAVDPEAGI